MVHISKDREFSAEIARAHGASSILHSVARIYGRPDAIAQSNGTTSWFYGSSSIAFLFQGNDLVATVELTAGVPRSVKERAAGTNGAARPNGAPNGSPANGNRGPNGITLPNGKAFGAQQS